MFINEPFLVSDGALSTRADVRAEIRRSEKVQLKTTHRVKQPCFAHDQLGHSHRKQCNQTDIAPTATCFDLSVGARAHSSLLCVIQFLLLQRYALFSDIPSIEPVKLRAVKINTPLLMQSDISFILDLYLPIVACTCDVSTLAKYHRIADRIPVLV